MVMPVILFQALLIKAEHVENLKEQLLISPEAVVAQMYSEQIVTLRKRYRQGQNWRSWVMPFDIVLVMILIRVVVTTQVQARNV